MKNDTFIVYRGKRYTLADEANEIETIDDEEIVEVADDTEVIDEENIDKGIDELVDEAMAILEQIKNKG